MTRMIHALLTTLLLPVAALAQEASALDGKWLARYTNDRGREIQVHVDIANGKATWQRPGFNKDDPCVGKTFPGVISDVQADSFKLDVRSEEVVPGCPSPKLTFRRSDDQTWKGEIGQARWPIKLERR